jgi:uncharacterized membrane protein required for colicin V production
MTALRRTPEENVAAKKWIPVLLIGIAGIFGAFGIWYMILPDPKTIELTMLLVIVGLTAVGYLRGTVRGLLTIIIIYISSAAGALLYRTISPFVNVALAMLRLDINTTTDDPVSDSTRALSFILVMLVFWGIGELLRGAFFQGASLPEIGVLDNLGGVFMHIVVGVLVASLLFNAYGYGSSRPVHHKAALRPFFSQVVRLMVITQSFLFGGSPPPFYTYDLNAP